MFLRLNNTQLNLTTTYPTTCAIFVVAFYDVFRKIGTISVTKKDGFVVYQDGQMNKRCVLFRTVELATATAMELAV